jgi:hypothetical protein
LMATVAMSPDIRTRTLRSWYTAISPSRMLTLRTADCLHASLATKNFRSISTGLWRSCNFGRSEFSPTHTHVLMEVFTRAAALIDQLKYDVNIQAWPDAIGRPHEPSIFGSGSKCEVSQICPQLRTITSSRSANVMSSLNCGVSGFVVGLDGDGHGRLLWLKRQCLPRSVGHAPPHCQGQPMRPGSRGFHEQRSPGRGCRTRPVRCADRCRPHTSWPGGPSGISIINSLD